MVQRRSKSNHTWPGIGVPLACMACALLLSFAAPAMAYDERQNLGRGDGDEAVLGTFHLKTRDEAGRLEQSRRARAKARVIESRTYSAADLMHMFADARAAREEGDVDEARRLFERIVAVRPNSELASKARKDLAALHRDQHLSGRKRARVAPDRSGDVYGPNRPATVEQARPAPRARQQPKQRSRRLVMLERQFIADVGDRIFFAQGSSELGARARAVLAAQADWLKAHPDIVVTIEGHADDGTGPMATHHNLSLARAEAVRQRLIREGISQLRLASYGRGGTEPVAVCASANCAAQNRRVVTVISAGPIRIVGESDGLFGDQIPKPDIAPGPRRGATAPLDQAPTMAPLR